MASMEQGNADLWHQRLCHLNEQQFEDVGVKMPKKMKLAFCQGCVEGKMHRVPFKIVGEIRST